MPNYKVIANVQDDDWNDPIGHQFVKNRPDLYGPRLIEELIRARSKTEAFFRMKDRHTMCVVEIVSLEEVNFEFDYVPSPWEDEEFFAFLYANDVT